MKLHSPGRRVTTPLIASAATLCLVLAGCGSSSETEPGANLSEGTYPEYYPAEYSQIVEASRDEDPLDVYSIMAAEDWAPLLEGFNKVYPWVQVRTVDLGTTEVFERYYAESATSAPTADAIVSIAADGWQRFMDRGELQAYESPELAELPEWSHEWAGKGLYAMSADPFSIVYNETLLPEGTEPPESFADVVEMVNSDPEFYQGRVATYSGDAQWGMFWFIDRKLREKFWDGMQTMGPALRFEASGGAIGEKMVSGEYALAFYVPLSTIPRGSDSFLKFALMDDGQPISDRIVGITKKANSPNSAKLLIDFLLSEEGQKLIPLTERVPYRPSVQAAVEETGWWHLSGIIDDVGEDAIIQMGPTPDILVNGEYDRIIGGFAQLQRG
ncbi:ABC transporter substrate-binding protein [Mycobacterium sp. NAZ190054]|uniref:ABC transporter substrate-binding protein n=1 Tax=Mycobacterium sp. NAZ190054 TaxID=1747766 RepID=UPI0007992618|nr:extracellular solute-binding protein [Mycobacterium sp. NAZ190054]KWX67764.1 hypothetical protein ASJ79_04175 [Mycobacterium sp. NAZ190054]